MNNSAQNPTANLPAVLNFEGVELKIIDRDGLPWITSGDLGRALGYKRGGDQVVSIYRQHAHEFCEAMTLAADLAVKGFGSGNSPKPVRIFSPRGAHLIGMFARTAKAAAFRRWVLDVLEGFAMPQAVTDAPAQPGIAEVSALRGMLAGNRFMCLLDEMGRITLREIPANQFLLYPGQVKELIAREGLYSAAQLEELAAVALDTLWDKAGTQGISHALRRVSKDFLLVRESELVAALYGSPAIWSGAARGLLDE